VQTARNKVYEHESNDLFTTVYECLIKDLFTTATCVGGDLL
jgi:hypothetical protein